MKKTSIVVILLLLCGSAAGLRAQEQNYVANVSKTGTSAASFLRIGVGARALSMGGAFVAIADDPTAIYWNVAGLAKLEQNGVALTHTEWFADINHDFGAVSFNLGTYGCLGLSFISLDMGEMDVRTVADPEGNGETFGGGDFALSVAYAKRLTEDFSIGINPKFIQETIWHMKARAWAVDLGAHYRTPFPGIILGMAITNFGTNMQMVGDNTIVLYDFDETTVGNNERTTADLRTDKWSLPLNFQVGMAYEAVRTDEHALTIALDALHPNNNYESVNAGFEYTFHNLFALRGGYKSLFLESSEESFAFGAGLKHQVMGNRAIHIDYAFADFGRLENAQKFSLGIDF